MTAIAPSIKTLTSQLKDVDVPKAKLIRSIIKASREDIRKALEGRITQHHRFMMKIIKESIDEIEKIILKVDKQIDKSVKQYQVEIDLLQTIPGINS